MAWNPGVYKKVVYFWVSLPNLHCAKLTCKQPATAERVRRSGMSQTGPWSEEWKNLESDLSPLSMGFSIRNSAPAPCATCNKIHIRRTSSFAVANSFA